MQDAEPWKLEERALRSGRRVNGRRRAVLCVLQEASDPPTAQEIYRRAVKLDRTLSMAGVYRTLSTLRVAP